MPGADRQTWYCSVAFAWKTSDGFGAATKGARADGLPVEGAPALARMPSTSTTRRSWSTLPAVATTTLSRR